MSRSAKDFIAAAGWADARVAPLAGDASNRRYDRLTRADGSTAVLMDAPPDRGEDVTPFLTIARHLSSLGLSAPRIYAEDRQDGFLLIEDLGDRLFAREMAAHPDMETTLYEAAVDVLVHLHGAPAPALPAYDAERCMPLAALAYDWYLFGATGAANPAARAAFCDRFHRLLAPLDAELTVLIQRDYHAENLLWLPERSGVARVGLLDFQDAVLGHPAYDLVSILQDARRDVPAEVERAMLDRFIDRSGADRARFLTAYAILGTQRALRILGVFARLCMRDSKAHYVDFIPRVWADLDRNLDHAALSSVADMLRSDLPEPTAAVLTTLKEKCGTCAGR